MIDALLGLIDSAFLIELSNTMASAPSPEKISAETIAGPYKTELNPATLLDLALLTMLVFVAWQAMKSRHLFAVVMLSGIYSLISAAFFVSLDAVDVAFTEAAVGAGISTVLMLGGMLLTARREKPTPPGRAPVALVIVLAVGAALFYATIDMPAFGDPNSPANKASSVGALYVKQTPDEIAVPNIVTAVLASYRGFDTLGETLVIFTAGIAVILLLGVGSTRGGRGVKDIADAPYKEDHKHHKGEQ